MNVKKLRQANKGITLIALVVTIVVLLILSGVTISMLLGEDGIIKTAQEAANKTQEAVENEQAELNQLYDDLDNILSSVPEMPEGPQKSEVEQAKEEGTIFEDTTVIKDKNQNKITIPGGFKIANDSGNTVQEGIVIEDVDASTDANVQGSQYVWIPVGKFVKDDGKESNEIILGRYKFDSNGTPILQQDAVNYNGEIQIQITDENGDKFETIEIPQYREGLISTGEDGLNATANELGEWINSTKTNGGYYIGRYEASYANGDISDYSTCKAASKISKAYSTTSMSYVNGTVWNYINQANASKVSINTYSDSKTVKSDLMNSYAWDTAIVYIQEAGNVNYANQTSKNSSLTNTGTIGDEVCKINDMASNLGEWSTEYSSYIYNQGAYPCVARGGYSFYDENIIHYKVFRRLKLNSTLTNLDIGFRIIIYI